MLKKVLRRYNKSYWRETQEKEFDYVTLYCIWQYIEMLQMFRGNYNQIELDIKQYRMAMSSNTTTKRNKEQGSYFFTMWIRCQTNSCFALSSVRYSRLSWVDSHHMKFNSRLPFWYVCCKTILITQHSRNGSLWTVEYDEDAFFHILFLVAIDWILKKITSGSDTCSQVHYMKRGDFAMDAQFPWKREG